MTTSRVLLLSLRPRFASAILDGTKTVEVRRRPINAAVGTPVILYASSPMRAVVGTARLAGVRVLSPNSAWREHSSDLGITREELRTYLDGAEMAHLLLLHRVNTLDEPLYLRDLREDAPFNPPQSFRYVTLSDPSSLHDLVPAPTIKMPLNSA
jgi:predicted transcriptional regulator